MPEKGVRFARAPRRGVADEEEVRHGEAVVEERQLLKTLRWYDGFVICLANPGFMLGSLGWSVLDLGGWGAALIWGLTALIIIPVTVIYSELAAMFPHKSGGIAIYANEGWRKYTTLVGPVATFGYWIGWSVVLSFIGLFAGYIAQTAWFPGEPYGTYAFGGAIIDDGYFSTGPVNIGLQHLIAVGLILCRLGLQLLRHTGRRELQLPGGDPAHVPALLLHVPAIHQRRLRLRQPHLQAERRESRLGRIADGSGLDLDHDLVDRTRSGRDFRTGVQGHGPRHEKGADVVGALHPLREHDGAHRPHRRCRRRRPWRHSTTSVLSTSSSVRT